MLVNLINKLRNGYMVFHFDVSFKEISFCTKILDLLWEEDLIRGYTKTNKGVITVLLRYHEGSAICTRLTVLSRPRDRLYISLLDLSRILNDFEVLIISTPKGIMTAKKAVRKGEGGEILAYVS